MKLKLSDKSLFAVLLRSPWWLSLLIAATMALLAWALLPSAYRAVGVLSCFPFVVIAAMSAWRQRHAPSTARVNLTAQTVAGLSWPAFADLLEQALVREGYKPLRRSGDADFEVQRQGRLMLVSAKRWKTAHTGIEPLRALQAEREKHEAPDAVYVSLGELSESARGFARDKRITIWQATDLAHTLRGLLPKA